METRPRAGSAGWVQLLLQDGGTRLPCHQFRLVVAVKSLSTQTITSFREVRQKNYRIFAQAGTALAIRWENLWERVLAFIRNLGWLDENLSGEKQRRTRTGCVRPCRRKMLFVLEAYSLYMRAGNRNSHSRNAHPYSRTNDVHQTWAWPHLRAQPVPQSLPQPAPGWLPPALIGLPREPTSLQSAPFHPGLAPSWSAFAPSS